MKYTFLGSNDSNVGTVPSALWEVPQQHNPASSLTATRSADFFKEMAHPYTEGLH